jgi:hypothetical protein
VRVVPNLQACNQEHQPEIHAGYLTGDFKGTSNGHPDAQGERSRRDRVDREEMIDALLRRIAAYTVVLKRQVREEDYKALKTLRPFLKAADRLMAEIGSQDQT